MGAGRNAIKDGAVAFAVAAVLVIAASSTDQPVDPLGFVLLAVGGFALGARRRPPAAVPAAAGLCALGSRPIGFAVPAVAYLFAVYFAVRSGHRTVAIGWSVAILAALPVAA